VRSPFWAAVPHAPNRNTAAQIAAGAIVRLLGKAKSVTKPYRPLSRNNCEKVGTSPINRPALPSEGSNRCRNIARQNAPS
jgi:hypothetical protein